MLKLSDGPRGLYFDDFEEGASLMSRARTITEADIVNFAALTGDFNPMHVDAEYAKNSFMGQRVAHGMLVMSYAVGQAYQLGILDGTILAFRSLEVKFSQPVLIGDTIRVELKVTEKKEAARLGGGTVDLEFRILNQENKAVQKGTMTMLMASKPKD
jgi:3-hydroxybutyryl-CoA dehydratase